jgi:hypothetical protein
VGAADNDDIFDCSGHQVMPAGLARFKAGLQLKIQKLDVALCLIRLLCGLHSLRAGVW